MFEFCFRANVATMIVCGQWFKFSVRLCFIYFLTSPLCLHYQVQPCGVEKRAGCSGPSTKIIWSKVGFVCCSRAPLWPWPVLGTPSSFPWFSLQLLLSISHRSVVILELFSLNRMILWQLLKWKMWSNVGMFAGSRCLRRHTEAPLWVCIKQLLNPLSNATQPLMSYLDQDPDISL